MEDVLAVAAIRRLRHSPSWGCKAREPSQTGSCYADLVVREVNCTIL